MAQKIVEEAEDIDALAVKPTEKKKEEKINYKVVKELPVQQVRQIKDEKTGIVTTYLTVEEALNILVGGD